MESKRVVLEEREGVALIKLNMPDRLNSLSLGLTESLLKTLQRVGSSRDFSAVVLTGCGKGFCAGGDLKEFSGQGDKGEYLRDLIWILHDCVVSIRRMPKPVVAAVNGVASGAGMSLVLACDLAVADENALLNMAYIRLGGSPDGGGSLFLARTLGLKRASDLIFTGRMVNAREALNMGLVNRIAPAGEALETALGMAEELSKGPSLAFAASKELINAALFPDLECHLERERRAFVGLGDTRDFEEGIRAFLDKRRPAFKGE
jgi:2-(1,2-epoxy-1,2-dihydrophenyl)acetyl-CoA isomerase